MCGCEHHWNKEAVCTCSCPEHREKREEQTRTVKQEKWWRRGARDLFGRGNNQ